MNHDEKLLVIRAMRTHGGSFVRLLAEAWLHADAENCRRIETAFPECVAKYREVAATMPAELA